MLPLHYARRWRIAGTLILTSILAAALSPDLSFLPGLGDFSLPLTDKWLHGITFAFLIVWFSGQHGRGTYGRLAVGMLAFGILIEACQLTVGYRNAEVLDVVADSIGIAAGFAITFSGAGGWSQEFERWWLTGRWQSTRGRN